MLSVVTGGARAMGHVIALELAERGSDVVILAPEEELLEPAADAVRQLGRQALAIQCDVADEPQVVAAFRQVYEQFAHVDVLVNNAGIAGPTAAVHEVERRDWDQVLAINLTGAYLCSRAVLPDMIQRREGRIINISSMAGRKSFPLRSPYAASKWGLIGLTLTLAAEVGSHNIQVNAICPGPVAGERIDAVIANKAAEVGKPVEEVHAEFVDATLLKRMVTQQDIASMVGYLVSPAGAAITGQALEVSAGFGV